MQCLVLQRVLYRHMEMLSRSEVDKNMNATKLQKATVGITNSKPESKIEFTCNMLTHITTILTTPSHVAPDWSVHLV